LRRCGRRGAAGLRVHVHHGKGKLAHAASLACFDVVLTTYTTMAHESPPRPEDLRRRGDGAAALIDLCDSECAAHAIILPYGMDWGALAGRFSFHQQPLSRPVSSADLLRDLVLCNAAF
jgi:hypothetical protein